MIHHVDPIERLSDHPYVVLDVETTGTDPDIDQICEVAAVRFEGGRIVDRFDTLVDPGVPIPPEASEVHHLTDRDVEGAPALASISDAIEDFVGNDLIVAHNAQFDHAFLPMLHKRQWLCSLRAVAHNWPKAPYHRNQYLRYWLKIDHPALSGVAAHRALGDAVVTGFVLHRILREYELRHPEANMARFAQHVLSPIRVEILRYGAKHRGKEIVDLLRRDPSYLRWILKDALQPDSVRRLNVDSDTLGSIRRALGRLAEAA